jgi:hypothetical protein
MIQTRHVFQIVLSVPSIVDVGNTPQGGRKIAHVSGGTFQGERLRGTVQPAPGGDWLLLRNDGVLMLDVRLTLETDDKHLIYMSYRGMRHGPKEVMERLGRGEAVDPSSYYFRALPSFETASEKYGWLNRAMFVSTGFRQASGPTYDVYEVL